MAVGLQTSIWSNRFKTLYLISLLPIITFGAIFLGFYFSYGKLDNFVLSEIFNSSLLSLPIIAIWFFIAVLFQKQIIFSFSGAKPITRQENPEIYNLVENLCISRGLSVPKIGILEDDSMNAFATGWNPKSSWIVFSRGLLNKLEKSEIEAVAGHELTHIINGDIKIMVISTVFIGIVGTIGEILIRTGGNSDEKGKNPLFIVGIILYIVSLIILPLVNLAVSRKREFLADAGSVELTKDRESMIKALQKISGDPTIESIEKQSVAQMCIENPFKKQNGFMTFFGNLFSTHPSIESRIEILRTY
ncbi:MAG: M48 family metallopeptidase [Candidatus Gracilibacteria bacterium]|nr:M48 family metallopeptidase [Candidatus Gracilibacteria bacterium]